MDFCIHNVRRKGLNAVERCSAASPPPPDSDEAAVLQALQNAWYSLFQVKKAVPGSGVEVLDVLREREEFITDMGFSQTAVPGLVLVTRVIPFADFTMTGGAGLPVPSREGLDVLHRQAVEVVRKMGIERLGDMTPEQDTELTATIIRLPGCRRRVDDPVREARGHAGRPTTGAARRTRPDRAKRSLPLRQREEVQEVLWGAG